MTREEVIQLLAIIRANYPNVKISDPAATVNAWQLTLGDYPSDLIFEAARSYMMKGKFFPTPADIIKEKDRILYTRTPAAPVHCIPATRAKVTAIPDGVTEEEFLDNLWNSLVESDYEMYPDEASDPAPVDNKDIGRCMPYEE